ncbi:alpha/beta hydrolase [Flavobacterium sp. HNIBRBA15423]|uniref:alpha/beta hydrolase n=1 Tax=Flavobacterium sp. HNIBRBA15423 TaxID=3458683 RepID=UPI0040451654
MKKIILFSFTVLLTALISIILFSYLTGNPTYPKSVIQTKLYSKILDEEREIIIHLPRDYDKNKKYMVMYVLDGSSQDKHIANKFDILATTGYVENAIVVGIPNVSGKGRQRDYTPPYMKMDIDEKDSPLGEGDNFLTFMEKELFPFIEKNYSVSENRTIAGNSRGGLLVMYSLLFKPDLFQGRFCFSPAIWRDDNLIVKKASEFLTKQDSLNSFLYISMGDQENNKMKKGFNEITKTLKEKAVKQFIWHSEYTKNANHQNNAEISASVGIRKWTEYLKLKN